MDNGLARKPPMYVIRADLLKHFIFFSTLRGWSSWNAWGGHQSADIMTDTGDLLVELGLADLGYTHVDMDGGW
jgi:hypothetical protein